MGCQNFNASYCADARCQADGICSENSSGYNDGDDECDNTCRTICSDDDDCKEHYGNRYSSDDCWARDMCATRARTWALTARARSILANVIIIFLVQRDFGTNVMCDNGHDEDCDGLTDDNGNVVEAIWQWNYSIDSCI